MSTFSDGMRTLYLLWKQTVRRWYIVVGSVAVCLLLTIVYCNVRPNQYTTTMVVTPADSSSNSLNSAMNALTGGGASLLGLVGATQSSGFDRFVILLQSISVSQDLLKDRRIMGLMFGDAIDPQTGAWRDTWRRRIKSGIFEVFGVVRQGRPTADDVQFQLNTMLVVDQDLLTKSKATVSCTATDTFTCHDILIAIAKAAQTRLNRIDFDNAQRMIAYLNQLLTNANGASNEVSLKQALVNVMASNQVQAALTSIGQQHAIVLDGPGIPSNPSFPKVPLLIEMSVLVGLLIGIGAAWYLRDSALFEPTAGQGLSRNI